MTKEVNLTLAVTDLNAVASLKGALGPLVDAGCYFYRLRPTGGATMTTPLRTPLEQYLHFLELLIRQSRKSQLGL